MNDVGSSEIRQEFVKSRVGLVGVGILVSLIILSAVSAITIPLDTFKQWNNPGNWISYPKTSAPAWINYFVMEKIPEHLILDKPTVVTKDDVISLTSHQFDVQYLYDDFPSDFIYEINVEYSGSQLLQISLIRPDNSQILLVSKSLPQSDSEITHHERIFSTDSNIKKISKYIFLKWNFIIKIWQVRI